MQRIKKRIYEKLFIGIIGTAWVAGLLIAGSDSPYMPWLNGIGLILFCCASILLGKLLNPSHSNAGTLIYPKFSQKPCNSNVLRKKKNQRTETEPIFPIGKCRNLLWS